MEWPTQLSLRTRGQCEDLVLEYTDKPVRLEFAKEAAGSTGRQVAVALMAHGTWHSRLVSGLSISCRHLV